MTKKRKAYPIEEIYEVQRRLLKLCFQSLRYENQDRLLAIGKGGALWTYREIRHHIRECLKLCPLTARERGERPKRKEG